jgi:hypothetical protein
MFHSGNYEPAVYISLGLERGIQNTKTCGSEMKLRVNYGQGETHLVFEFAYGSGDWVFEIFKVFSKDRGLRHGCMQCKKAYFIAVTIGGGPAKKKKK